MSTLLEGAKNYTPAWERDSAVARSAVGQLRSVIVSAVFPPEFTFSATTSAAIAEELANRGHAVTVLAPFPNKPEGRLFDGYKRRMYARREISQRCTLVHCFGTLAPRARMIPRFLENLSFGATAGLRLLCCRRPDVIYSNAWPVFATAMIVGVAALRRIPVVVSVQDVYPESLASQGRTTRQGLIYRTLHALDTWISQSATALILISPRFQEIYCSTRSVSEEKVHVVPNWGERENISIDASAAQQFREAKGIPGDAFVAAYAGNVGPACGGEGLIEAFGKLKDLRNVYLLIAGSGSHLESCISRSKELCLDRVIFHSPWKREETATVLGAADVVLLPTVGKQSLASVPSKLISYMLAGRPVIAQVMPESETANLISSADAGWVVPPDDPESLARAMRDLINLPLAELQRRGQAGKRFAEANLCRESNLPQVIHILESAAKLNH